MTRTCCAPIFPSCLPALWGQTIPVWAIQPLLFLLNFQAPTKSFSQIPGKLLCAIVMLSFHVPNQIPPFLRAGASSLYAPRIPAPFLKRGGPSAGASWFAECLTFIQCPTGIFLELTPRVLETQLWMRPTKHLLSWSSGASLLFVCRRDSGRMKDRDGARGWETVLNLSVHVAR